MIVYGVDVTTVTDAVAAVAKTYDGNVILKSLTGWNTSKGPRASYALRAESSRKSGARYSGSGRATVASCWHVHRDVLASIFAKYPDARVVSGLGKFVDGKFKRTVYEGRAGFENNFPATAWINVGGSYIGTLCDCEA